MRWFIPSAVILVALSGPSAAAAQVCHRGTVGETSTRWETTFAAPTSFVGALPADVEVVSVEGGELVTSARGIVGVARGSGDAGTILLVTRQTTRDATALHPPLASGPQRVVLTTGEHELVAFTSQPDAPLESYVGYHASAGIDEAQRRALDAACGPSDRGAVIYLEASSFGDLRGRVVRGSDRRAGMFVATTLVLALGLFVGVVAYRRLSARAQIEHADALLDRRFRELEDVDTPTAAARGD